MRLIDADALNIRKYTRWFEDLADERQVERMIREAPTIDAEPVKRGKWIDMGDGDYSCSNCKDVFTIDIDLHPFDDCGMYFCPNCGAKMDKESENNV